MQTVTLDDEQKKLPEIIHQLKTIGEVVIVESDCPVARLSPFSEQPSLRNLRPTSVGAVLRPFPSPGDDLLDEMVRSSE